MPEIPSIFFNSFGKGSFDASWRFGGYVETITAMDAGAVVDALNQAEQAAAAGKYAVGFVAYEAASALNPELPSRPPLEGLPLVWFAVFQERFTAGSEATGPFTSADIVLQPLKADDEYAADIARIRSYIAAGDCYQVNHTFPLQGEFQGNVFELYRRASAAQRAPFCACIDLGRFTIMSASPELFFALKAGKITTRPMKGTARRGNRADEDRTAVQQLRDSSKDKAENLMIVDLLRNDLGRVAETGSVSVDTLFDVETYPTVHQMTSTVTADLRPGTTLTDIFATLFPCGSVTGAPKRRSMEIIAELEDRPRGVYCGAIGCVAPGGEALFSVAIRTLLFDRHTNILSMGVGSAITWDSEAAAEYDECGSKGAFVNQQPYDFCLVETLRLENGSYTLLDRHLDRLGASAEYFGFICDIEIIRTALSRYAAQTSDTFKVRLLVAADGSHTLTADPLVDEAGPLRLGISPLTVHSNDRFCYHKTTRRERIDFARSTCSGVDEVLLCNEHGQLTEGSYHTLIVKRNGQLVTPPLSCGLLPGVLRGELLASGEISEQILYPDDLEQAEELWLINSVRGWRRAILVKTEEMA